MAAVTKLCLLMNCSLIFAHSAQYWLYFHLSFPFRFLKRIFMLFISLFLAVLGLCCCAGFSLVWSTGSRGVDSVILACGLSCPAACGILLGWTHVPCIGRWILNHWTAREAPPVLFCWSWSEVSLTLSFPHHSYPGVRSSLPGSARRVCLSPSSRLSHPGVVITAQGPLLHISFVNLFWFKSTLFPQVVMVSGSFMSVLSVNRCRPCAAKWHHGILTGFSPLKGSCWVGPPKLSGWDLPSPFATGGDGNSVKTCLRPRGWCSWRRAQTGPLVLCPAHLGGTDGLSSK